MKPSKVLVYLCWAMAVVLVVNTVRLVSANRSLTDQLDNVYRTATLPPGVPIPPLVGRGPTGEIIIDTASEPRPVLVLVFSPTCPACDVNWPTWDSLVAVQQRYDAPVVSVDISGRVRSDYLDVHGISEYPLITSAAPETSMAFRFRFTPQTLILQNGKVVAGWTGVLSATELRIAVERLSMSKVTG